MNDYKCRFCKRVGLPEFEALHNIPEKDRDVYAICDRCYYEQRLCPEHWLHWLRSECGQNAIYRRGCVLTCHGIACRNPYVPADEYSEEEEIKKLDKIEKFMKEKDNG